MTPFPGTPIHEMAIKGEGGYRMLAEDWRGFDKYSPGVLELEGVSLGQLKVYQIRCYIELYVRNSRWPDLARLMLAHYRMAFALLRSTAAALVREQLGRTRRRPSSRGVRP